MKHTIKGYITFEPSKWDGQKPTVDFYTYDPTRMAHRQGSGMVVVREHSFEVEVPDDFDPRPQQVAAIDAAIAQARADFTARLTELQEQKQRLLAIENTVDAA